MRDPQVHEYGKGAALFGYTKLYGHVPGAQAELLRVPQAQFGPIKVPDGPPDERYLFLSDVLPTAWQAVVFAEVPAGGSLAVLGLGPIGQMADGDSLGLDDFVTHRLPLDEAPSAYKMFQAKDDGAIKVVLSP